MKTYRRFATVAMVGMVALTGAACQDKATTTTASPSPTAAAVDAVPPRQALEAALQKTTSQPARFSMDMSFAKQMTMTMAGGADIAGKKMDATMTMKAPGNNMTIKMLMDGPALYAQMSGGAGKLPDGKKWMKMDPAKLSKASGGADFTDPSKMAGIDFLKATVDVQRDGENALRGTIDFTKVGSMASVLKGAPAEAKARLKAVPFTAKVDAEGRLTELELNDSSIPMSVKTAYRDFGTPITITAPPAAQVVEMPAS